MLNVLGQGFDSPHLHQRNEFEPSVERAESYSKRVNTSKLDFAEVVQIGILEKIPKI